MLGFMRETNNKQARKQLKVQTSICNVKTAAAPQCKVRALGLQQVELTLREKDLRMRFYLVLTTNELVIF